MNRCAVCNAPIEGESPAILTMGGFGHPRYLCPACAERFDTVTTGHDPEEISAAAEKITADLAVANSDDEATYETVKEVLTAAATRADAIRAGTYDFSDDGKDEGEGLDEIPEELRESEEDRALDREEEEKNQKFDRVLNFVWLGIAVAAVAFLIYWLVR